MQAKLAVPRGGFGDSTISAALAQFSAQGQGYFEASGDEGSYVTMGYYQNVAADPSLYLSPLETLVGGTSVNTTNPSSAPSGNLRRHGMMVTPIMPIWPAGVAYATDI